MFGCTEESSAARENSARAGQQTSAWDCALAYGSCQPVSLILVHSSAVLGPSKVHYLFHEERRSSAECWSHPRHRIREFVSSLIRTYCFRILRVIPFTPHACRMAAGYRARLEKSLNGGGEHSYGNLLHAALSPRHHSLAHSSTLMTSPFLTQPPSRESRQGARFPARREQRTRDGVLSEVLGRQHLHSRLLHMRIASCIASNSTGNREFIPSVVRLAGRWT